MTLNDSGFGRVAKLMAYIYRYVFLPISPYSKQHTHFFDIVTFTQVFSYDDLLNQAHLHICVYVTIHKFSALIASDRDSNRLTPQKNSSTVITTEITIL